MDGEKVAVLSEHRVLLRGKASVRDQLGLKVYCEHVSLNLSEEARDKMNGKLKAGQYMSRILFIFFAFCITFYLRRVKNGQ